MALNKRRIVILSPSYPLRGGIAQFGDALAESLSGNNEVKIISFKRQYPKALFPGKSQLVDDVQAEKIKADFVLDSIGPLSYRKTAREINNFQPDVVITAHWMWFMVPSLVSVLKRVRKQCAKIALVHNYISHDAKFYDAPLAKRFIASNDAVLCLSKGVEKEIARDFPKKPAISIPHPNYNHFGDKLNREVACEKLGIDSTKKNLLFFGLIRPYKGLDVLLEAAKHLDEGFQILVAGECYGDFTSYQKLIDQNKRVKTIVHQKFIADKDVPMYFSAADLCVLPYRSATQSGVTAVAHHFDLPVVATKVGGLDEFVENEVNGYLVPPEDPKQLAQKVTEGFATGAFEQFSENLKKSTPISWSDFARTTEDFIVEIQG